jgi:flagellar brake protein
MNPNLKAALHDSAFRLLRDAMSSRGVSTEVNRPIVVAPSQNAASSTHAYAGASAHPHAQAATSAPREGYRVDFSAEYRVTTRPEIIAALRALTRDRVLANAHFGGRHDFILTRMLAINPETDEAIFDASTNAEMNAALSSSDLVSIEAEHNQIKIIFDARELSLIQYEGKPAFRFRLPSMLLRLQRRSDFRARTPVLAPATLTILLPSSNQVTEFRVSDISSGGLAFTATPHLDEFSSGMIYPRCRLQLPDFGEHLVTIEIRHIADYTDGMGKKMRRLGARFLGLKGQTAPMIQRYVNQLETKRRLDNEVY